MVLVLFYSVCCSVSVRSCVDIIQSFMYVLHITVLLVTERHGAREQEKMRGDTNGLLQIPSNNTNKREIKQEPLVVACLLLPTSNLLLPSTVYIWLWWAGLEVGKPNNILANNRQANGHSHEGQRKATWWTTRQTRGRTTHRRIGSWSTCCTR